MKRLLIALLVTVLGVSTTSAQGQDTAKLEQKYKKKLEKEYVTKVPWVMTMEKAKKLSKEQKKPILAYFTRSYAP